jgi:hypothetical protein
LLDKVPSHLILGDLRLGVCGGSGSVGGGGSLVVVLRCVGVVGLLLVEAVLRRIVAVRHG